jgi:hypothetical protein
MDVNQAHVMAVLGARIRIVRLSYIIASNNILITTLHD